MLRYTLLFLASALSISAAAGDTLSADEVKKLIADKTVQVTNNVTGKQFKIFFAQDGKGYDGPNKIIGTWEVKATGEQCTSWAPPKYTCAKITNLGNGQYGRVDPDGKGVAATWSKIEDGNKL